MESLDRLVLSLSNTQSLTRRAAVNALFASLVFGTLAGRAAAQAAGPPHLTGSKIQFTSLDPAKPMPALKLFHVNGKPADLAPKPGKAMLVNFWATWCDACSKELLLLEDLQKVFGKSLDIVAIAHDGGGQSVVEPYLHKQGIKNLDIYLDPDGIATGVATHTRQAGPFVLYTTPMYYLVTPQGRIAGYLPGAVDWTSDSAHALIAYFLQTE